MNWFADDTFSILFQIVSMISTSMKLLKEIWNALEENYKTEKIGTNKFIIQK